MNTRVLRGRWLLSGKTTLMGWGGRAWSGSTRCSTPPARSSSTNHAGSTATPSEDRARARMAVEELDWWAARPHVTPWPPAVRSVQAVGWARLLLAIQGRSARSSGLRTGWLRRKAAEATSTMS